MNRVVVRSRPAIVAAFVALVGSLAGATSAGAATATPVMSATSIAGPITLITGVNRANVAHLDVTSGNWTVFAKAEVDNTDSNPSHHNSASCALRLGSTTQVTNVAPAPWQTDGSHTTLLLTVSAHLSKQDRAVLSCSAPGSAKGAEKIRSIRIVGVRTTALSLGHAPYKNYGDQTSRSHVYHVQQGGPVQLSSKLVLYPIASLSLHSGDWTVTASATAVGSGSGSGYVECQIETGTDYDLVDVPVRAAPGFGHQANIHQQVAHHANGDWNATLWCQSDSSSMVPSITGARLTAYRADVLINQPVAQDDTYPTVPPSVKPLVLAGWRDGPFQLAAGSSFHGVADQVLQGGRWVVVAKVGWLDHSSATGRETVTCRLGPGASADSATLVLGGHSADDADQPFMLIWFGAFTERTKVALMCKTPTGHVTATMVKLIAYRAGTLKLQ